MKGECQVTVRELLQEEGAGDRRAGITVATERLRNRALHQPELPAALDDGFRDRVLLVGLPRRGSEDLAREACHGLTDELLLVRRRHLLEHVLLEAADAVLHGLEEELFLVAEVVVDGALGDAGIARDAGNGGALVAEAREAIDRGGHELLARRLGSLGPRFAAARHTERSVSSLTHP